MSLLFALEAMARDAEGLSVVKTLLPARGERDDMVELEGRRGVVANGALVLLAFKDDALVDLRVLATLEAGTAEVVSELCQTGPSIFEPGIPPDHDQVVCTQGHGPYGEAR